MSFELSAVDVTAFKEDGAVCLRGVFSDWVESLRAGVDYNMSHPGPFGREYTKDGQPGRFFGDYCNWDRISEYREFMLESPAAEVAARLTGSERMQIFHEHVLVKEPGTLDKTPWHHDQPYYCVDGNKVCSLWIPLDEVSKETCPEFIAGSHAWGRWFLPRKFSGVDYDHTASHLEPIPNFDAERDQHKILSWDLAPGDAIAFHFLTVHGAPANQSNTRRRGFSARWMGDDAVFAPRSGEISPPFPGLGQRLSAGEPLTGAEFPVVWRATS